MGDGMEKYKDIIDLGRPISKSHPQMPPSERAAQFAPFAALCGYGDAIAETARHTEPALTLTEEEKERINYKLVRLSTYPQNAVTVSVRYFSPDARKSGGEYLTVSAPLEYIDERGGAIVLEGGVRIPFEFTVSIDFADSEYNS